jgi:hypothetical protein
MLSVLIITNKSNSNIFLLVDVLAVWFQALLKLRHTLYAHKSRFIFSVCVYELFYTSQATMYFSEQFLSASTIPVVFCRKRMCTQSSLPARLSG